MSRANLVSVRLGELAWNGLGSGSTSLRGTCGRGGRVDEAVSPWGEVGRFGVEKVPEGSMRRCAVQKQAHRQQARLRARQARAKVLEEQAGKERRLARWGEAVAVALAERDEAVAECEQRAGRALRSLIEEGGLKTQEALAWCGSETLTGREVHRLIRGIVDADGDHLN